jgi:hypothetical protein
MKRRRDPNTTDLFADYVPQPVVERFAPERVRAVSAAARIKRAIAETIKESRFGRSAIALLMSEATGETVTAAMLDQYTSTANDKHNIPAYRLVALYQATGDIRLINALLEGADVIAVPGKYEALIRREMAKEQRDRLDQEINAADAQWRIRR